MEVLGRELYGDVGCKELKGRLTGLLDGLHGVMRRLRQIGRNETGGKTPGLRSPEHGIRHATQSALLMTWDWRGETSWDVENTSVGKEWRTPSQLLDGRCRWFGARVNPMARVFPDGIACDRSRNLNTSTFLLIMKCNWLSYPKEILFHSCIHL